MTGTRGMVRQLYDAVEPIAPRLPYHNMPHMLNVTRSCRMYARMEGLGPYELRVLTAAGMLHDVVYVPGRMDNEERSVEVARRILPDLGYSWEEIGDISRAIMATKLPTKPCDIVEMVICDSDIDSAGREDFLEKGELLRQEFGIDRTRWYGELQPKFLAGVRYYTDSARKLRETGLVENAEKLRRLNAR